MERSRLGHLPSAGVGCATFWRIWAYWRQPPAPRHVLPGASAYVYAEADGVFEPFHLNGDAVRAGQAAGRVWRPWEAGHDPVTLHYGADGVVYGRRPIGRVRPGNCCAIVAQCID